MANPDASREAAHRRYEKAGQIAADAGSFTQAGLNEAYRQLFNNADWVPEENWASGFQEGPQAWMPSDDADDEYKSLIQPASSYLQSQMQESSSMPVTMGDEDDQKSVVVDAVRPSQLESDLDKKATDDMAYPGLDPSFSISLPGMKNLNDLDDDEKVKYFQDRINDKHTEDVAAANQYAQSLVDMNYGAMGVNPNMVVDDTYNTQMESAKGIDEIPKVYADIQRRFEDENGDFMVNPLGWNIIGFTSQRKSGDDVRNLYETMFAKEDAEGYKPQHAYDFKNGVMDSSDIDDGSNPRSRESLYMTGERYKRYRDEYGIPGRDVNDIVDDEIYSKQDEMENYGFLPYIVSDRGLDEFHNQASAQATNNAFNNFANARRILTDYGIDYDGQHYSGKDLVKNYATWSKNTIDQWNDPSRLVTDESQADEFAVPQTIEVTMEDGTTEKVIGEPYGYTDEDGTLVWLMPDGSLYRFADEDDFRESVKYMPADDGDYVAAWLNVDPLELDDGQKIRADKANYLMQENEGTGQKNIEQYSDYGYWNKPYVSNPIEEGRWLPWLVDMALGSSPLFYGPTAGAQAMGNAYANNSGFAAGSDDYLNGTYSMLSDDPTEEQRNTSVLGSAALPLTEHIWGNLGNAAFKGPLTKLAARSGKAEGDIAPLLRFGIDAAQEGMEEIPGNLVEEFQRNGISDFYADDLLDENGNLVLDDQGRIMKAPTDVTGRMRNFIEDIPLAFLGGASLGGALGTMNLPGYRNEYNARKAERDMYGNNLKIPEFGNNVAVDLTDEERDMYNYR